MNLLRRDRETIRKDQIECLEIKNYNAQVKNTLHWNYSRLDTEEEKVNALENNEIKAPKMKATEKIFEEITAKNF